MNAPHFEVFPQKRQKFMAEPGDLELTGRFSWHYRDRNGKLTHAGGQGFSRREDAHRSIIGVSYDYGRLVLGVALSPEQRSALVAALPIIDLDEHGKVMSEGAKP